MTASQNEAILAGTTNVSSLISYWLKDMIMFTNEEAAIFNSGNGNPTLAGWQSARDAIMALHRKQQLWQKQFFNEYSKLHLLEKKSKYVNGK